MEVAESEVSPNLSAKKSDCTHANSSSSVDSVKADTELTSKASFVVIISISCIFLA